MAVALQDKVRERGGKVKNIVSLNQVLSQFT
jgi:hypothetical protein